MTTAGYAVRYLNWTSYNLNFSNYIHLHFTAKMSTTWQTSRDFKLLLEKAERLVNQATVKHRYQCAVIVWKEEGFNGYGNDL